MSRKKSPSLTHAELLISPEEIQEKITAVAHVLDAAYKGEEITVVIVMKGALCLAADLIRTLQTPCLIEAVTASSYGHRGTQRGELTITGLDKTDLSGKHVLVIDDIFDSGETLAGVVAKIEQQKPKTLKSLVLLAKNIDRTNSYRPDYVLFPIENHFVIGYGLDYKEHYRGLPGIYMFKSGTP